MMKVMTIVGTRPELIKMSRVIDEFEKHTNHILVHTGQNYDYELNQVFFEDLNIPKPKYFLDASGETAAATIGRVIEKVDNVLLKEKPDAVLLYGDTNSCLAVISAKRRKIPVFHMEAGNRCFDQRVPEELNRKVVDHLSDINFVLTEHARRYLIAEGISQDTIIKTGSHMKEVLDHHSKKINTSNILQTLNLKRDQYFLISIHREENVDKEENLLNIIDTLNELAGSYDLPVIVSTHPRTQKRLSLLKDYNLDDRVSFMKPFSFTDYIKLQTEALCVLSDSGTLTEEASILNLPAITIRNAHERPEGMDVGALMMAGLKKEKVLHAVKVILASHDRSNRLTSKIEDYQTDLVSKKLVRVVLSYIDYVKKNVWSIEV
ncbi:MAG: UDP-N-acetylglucosamine 2-epimerase (non-hydrolyzing) [Legionellales bacterium]|nr:UDP-N-acetylglucosamine 2-epimerase (non-hydrolyzing) [Legionellales bacterium]OUX65901.1 MAG: UDP-N-acetylglucosamine 2-epimerase (non-hydrolyzing) [Gammaproteobacteria bacterium TMED281]